MIASELTPGIHSLSYEQYAMSAGINVSSLSLLTPPSTPAHFRAAFIDRTAKLDETEALTFGTWEHRLVLEPDTIEGAFYVKPRGMSFAKTEGKQWRDAHSDKPIIPEDDVTDLIGIRDALWAHPTVKRLLAGAETERCLFATDSAGALRKARLDALTKGSVIPDLKTCERADEFAFAKQIASYGYYRSAAWYLDICNLLGIEKTAFCFIAVEKKPPYAIAIWSLDEVTIEHGRRQNERNLAVYRECMKTGEWPSYPAEIGVISLPAWLQKEMENAA